MLLLAPALYGLAIVGTRAYSLEGFYWTRWTDPAAIVGTAALVIGLGLLLDAGAGSRLGGVGLPDSPKFRWKVPSHSLFDTGWKIRGHSLFQTGRTNPDVW